MNNSVTKLARLRQDPAPLRNQIIASVRRAIEIGALQPGVRLVERELCEQLNVSRTSLREALRELQALGVLGPIDNRGLAVAVLSAEEAGNIYAIRTVLEGLVVRQFVELATDEAINELAALGEKLKKAYVSGAVERIVQAKRAFYTCMCLAAHNAEALDIIDRLTLRTSSLRSRSLARAERQVESIQEIDAIIAAIKGRDSKAASEAASLHVQNAARSALGSDTPATTDVGATKRRRPRIVG